MQLMFSQPTIKLLKITRELKIDEILNRRLPNRVGKENRIILQMTRRYILRLNIFNSQKRREQNEVEREADLYMMVVNPLTTKFSPKNAVFNR